MFLILSFHHFHLVISLSLQSIPPYLHRRLFVHLYVSASMHAPAHDFVLRRPVYASDTEIIQKMASRFAVVAECGRRQWQLDSPVLRRCVTSQTKRSETSKPGSSFKTELRTSDSYIIFV